MVREVVEDWFTKHPRPVESVHGILALHAFLLNSLCSRRHTRRRASTIAAQDLSFHEMRWRDIGPTRAGRARAAGRRRQPAEHVLRRLRQRRRLAIHRLRRQLGADLRRPVHRLDRRDRRRAVEPERHLRRAPAPASSVPIWPSATACTSPPTPARTWQHLGLRDSQMIAAIAVDPGNRRSAVRRRARPSLRSQRRARRVPLDRRRPHLREGALQGRIHQRQRSPDRPAAIPTRSTRRCGRSNRASSRARDSATPAWASSSPPTAARRGRSSREGLPAILQANIAIAPSDPNILYAAIAPGQGPIGFYKSTDGGAHWFQAIQRAGRAGRTARRTCGRWRASAAAICQPSPSIPRIPNVVYTASTVMWRTMDGGLTWSAVRGAPGGDDYQRIWINPNDPHIILAVADQGAVVSANRGRSWSNWYNQNTARDVSRDDRQRVSVSRLLGPAGFGQRVRAEPVGRRPHHVPRLASGQHPGIRDGRAGPEEPRRRLRQPAQRRVALRPPHRRRPRRSDPTRRARCPAAAR